MHRHGYKGRKFNRETDQRRSMMKSLADSLILHEKIETTLPKAKDLRPYVEKLVTKAKKGDLHNRRLIIANLQTIEAAHKLVDEIAPKLMERTSGYLRIARSGMRRGDNAEMATISFVDDLNVTPVAAKAESVANTETIEKPAVKKSTTKAKLTAKKEVKV